MQPRVTRTQILGLELLDRFDGLWTQQVDLIVNAGEMLKRIENASQRSSPEAQKCGR